MPEPSGIFNVFERKKRGGQPFFTRLEKITAQETLVDFGL
jgi:hypothetical protein